MNRLAKIIIIALICAATLAYTQPVFARAILYPGNRKTINCAVAWIPDPGNSSVILNIDEVRPFVSGGAGDLFGKLDAAYTKPADWALENPAAPTDPNTGLKYPKWDERYWRIILHEDTDLTDFDVIYMPASGNLELEPRQREVLRKFVDSGGILWIDNSGLNGGLDFRDTFFVQNFRFANGGPTLSVEMGQNHPLLSFPYWLNSIDIANVGRGGSIPSFFCVPGYDMGTRTWNSMPTAFDVLLPVAGFGNTPTVAANAYGSGHIVATSNFVGRGIFRHSNELDNISGMKFVYNMISWSSDWTSVAKNSRRTASALDTIGGNGVVAYWSHEVPMPGLGATATGVPRYSSSAVAYKNIAFYSNGNTLYALGLIPKEDLDGDGNWNDGDQTTGGVADTNQDLIFRWSAPDGSNLISSPTVVTMLNPVDPSKTVEAVAVTTSSGNLFILDAWPVDADGRLQAATTLYTSFAFGDTFDPPSAPVYANGWFYCMSGTGRLYAYNPSVHEYCKSHGITDQNNWTWVNPQNANFNSAVGPFRGGPSFAYVTSDITQAIIGTMYWATGMPGSGASNLNDQIVSLPLFVSHDRVRFSVPGVPSSPTTIMLNHTGGARIANYPSPCWVEIHWTNAAGVKQYQRIDYGPGDNGLRNLNPSQMAVPFALERDMVVYANYVLDYSPTGLTPTPNRVALLPLADNAANPDMPTSLITSTPAVGSKNTLFVNSVLDYSGFGSFAPYAGGAINAIRMDTLYEEGAPNNIAVANTVAWSYLLHQGKELQLPSQERIAYGGGYLNIPPVLTTPEGDAIEEPRPYGAPVTSDGKVFVAVTGYVRGNPVSAILCLREKMDFVIRVVENAGYAPNNLPRGTGKVLRNPTTQAPYRIKLWQPNLLTANDPRVNPLQQAVDVRPQDRMVDYDRGTITINDFSKIKIKAPGNSQGYTLSASLPVWVFLDDREVPVDFSTWIPRLPALDDTVLSPNVRNMLRPNGDAVDLSRWNNLLWYFVVPNNRQISSTPMVLGNKLYFLTNDGLLASINTDNGLTQAERLEPDSSFVQPMLNIPGFGSLNISDRVNNYLSASNGVILAPGSNGLFAASNLPTLVADGTKVVEIDGAGELKMAIDKISMPVSIPQASGEWPPRISISVNKPAAAKYTAKGDILLVNTGSNQVFLVDKTGNVGLQQVGGGYIRWMYNKFSDPYQILKSGQPNTISMPTDAEFWTEIEGGEFVYHCMIVDAGNHRVLDLVYRIDTATNVCLNTEVDLDTGFILPELRWTTRSDKRYTIQSAQKVTADNSGDLEDIWIAVSAVQSMNGVTDPDIAQGAVIPVPYRESTGPDTWNYVVPNSGVIEAKTPVATGLVGLRYARAYGTVSNRYMFISDKFGVSKLNIATDGTLSLAGQLKDEDYRNRPGYEHRSLTATSVQEVSLGNWLIVNSYVGGDFSGEIFEYSPTEPLSNAFKVICPSGSDNTYNLHQPASANRAF